MSKKEALSTLTAIWTTKDSSRENTLENTALPMRHFTSHSKKLNKSHPKNPKIGHHSVYLKATSGTKLQLSFYYEDRKLIFIANFLRD